MPFGRATLDRAHHAVERRHARFLLIECPIDDGVETLAEIRWWEVLQRSIEPLENRVIELPLLALMHLQLAVGIVVIDDPQDPLEQKLLRAFAEILEIRRRDRLLFVNH